jgi:hypothetical protein
MRIPEYSDIGASGSTFKVKCWGQKHERRNVKEQESERKSCLQNALKRQNGGGGGVAQIMYTHVSKCKNDKIQLKKKEKKNSRMILLISFRIEETSLYLQSEQDSKE